jgi:predicted metalloprotease
VGDAVSTACGDAPAAVGPFYCPTDERVYLDLSFFDELAQRFGAPGDFAQAYVIAHELGHHVQHVLGIEQRVRQMQGTRPGAANQLSVALELQADCFAGVWGNSTSQRRLLQQGDVEEGLAAASAVGDDRIQAQMTGQIRPDKFTHGSAAQRAQWFRRGLESGDPNSCDTFGSLGRG